MFNDERGQSLIEVVITLMIATVVIGALAIATIVGIRNAQFSQNQTQATKMAQAAMEQVRANRNRNSPVILTYASGTTATFTDLWTVQLNSTCGGPCFFKLNSDGSLTSTSTNSKEDIGNGFSRQVLIEDANTTYTQEKKVSVKVLWTDTSGQHQSQLQTILTKL